MVRNGRDSILSGLFSDKRGVKLISSLFHRRFWRELYQKRWHPRYWQIRSASIRFALAYSFIFIVSAGTFLSFTWWSTTNLLDRHVQAEIDADAGELLRRWELAGPNALRKAMEERLEQNVDDDELYLLLSPNGQRLAGNLPGWPVLVKRFGHFYELSIRRYQLNTRAKLKAWPLPGHYQMIVGHDVRGRALLRHVITQSFVWCSIMVALLALGGAMVFRRLFRHMVSSIARTTSAVAQGDLTQRMVVNGSETDPVAETVNTMLDRINKLMEGVKQVSNAIAHDLRTPIARARTRLEDAALHAKTPEALQEAIDQAVSDLDHITGIFEALLRIAQIEAGARRSAFDNVNLNLTLDDMAEFYTIPAEEAGLTLILDAPRLPNFFGDAHLLQQALANMLDNAIKFTPSGGKVILTAHFLPQDVPFRNSHLNTLSPHKLEDVHLYTNKYHSGQDGMIKISVSDQGPGMKEGEISRAHERFFRADTARSTPGSGLGLSLVQAIASLHDGSLILTNLHPGLKSTLLLPLRKSPVKEDLIK